MALCAASHVLGMPSCPGHGAGGQTAQLAFDACLYARDKLTAPNFRICSVIAISVGSRSIELAP